MKFIRQISLIALLLSVAGCAARPAAAQFIGYTSPQTTTQPVFSSSSCASGLLKSANLTNIGQSVHVVTYSLTPGAGNESPILRIMGSFDGISFVQLSDDGTVSQLLSQTSTLTGYGAYPFVQIWVVNGSTGCTATANYMGTSVSTTNPTGSSDLTAYYKVIAANPSAGNSYTSTILTPYGNSAGSLTLSFSLGPGPAGSTIQVETEDPNTLATSVIATYAVSTAQNASQTFRIPTNPSPYVVVIYTAGTASTSDVGISYAFYKPGAEVTEPQCPQSMVINTAAAGPTQEIAALAGAKIRICSINVSSGTAEAIDFQQGTGTNCGTNNVQLTGLTHLAANSPWIQNFPTAGLVAIAGNAVCIHLSGANQTDGTITYSDY